MEPFVPLVDLSGWGHGPADDQAIATAIDQAASEIGFFQITGHGIDPSFLAELRAAAVRLFSLRPEEKAALVPSRVELNRGYAPIGSESLAYSLGIDSMPDLFEAFNVGPDDVSAEAFPDAAESAFAANVWPDLEGFRSDVVSYFGAVRSLAHRLTEIFAVALGLPRSHFEPFTDHSTDLLRANHYSLAPGHDPLPGQFGMGPHTDYGIVTVLAADPVAGLELLGADGEWLPVVPEPGALLVNLGDLLAQWTNDRWRSTVHRVQPPRREADGRAERFSFAFFHDGNYDALVECLETCTSSTNPPRYAPVVAGEHLRAKLLGPRTMTRSDAVSTLSGRDAAVARP